MPSILDHCRNARSEAFAAGTVLLDEGVNSGRLLVLVSGTVEVLRGETQVAVMSEPGAVFGEMSVLLGQAHTATVRAITPVTAYAFPDADAFLRSNPAIAFFIARLLAQRLNAATTYLVDLKHQFEGHGDHLGMVGEVLESLIHHPDREVTPGSDLRNDPRM
jgi:CRP/FNR family transcriptional regulator, cyclic AMP receptor protein